MARQRSGLRQPGRTWNTSNERHTRKDPNVRDAASKRPCAPPQASGRILDAGSLLLPSLTPHPRGAERSSIPTMLVTSRHTHTHTPTPHPLQGGAIVNSNSRPCRRSHLHRGRRRRTRTRRDRTAASSQPVRISPALQGPQERRRQTGHRHQAWPALSGQRLQRWSCGGAEQSHNPHQFVRSVRREHAGANGETPEH